MKQLVILTLSLLLMSGDCWAEPVVLDVHTPLGFFGDPDGNFRNVTVNEEVTRIEARVMGDVISYISAVPDDVYRASWPDGIGWTKLTYTDYTTDLSGFGTFVHDFNPFGSIGGERIATGISLHLPPSERGYSVGVVGPDCLQACSGTFLIEFGVESISPPIVGDFDFDDIVGFSDFLILSANFGTDPNSQPRWDLGDADLSGGTIGFPDFLLLQQHFGETRVTGEAMAAPEPTANITAMLGCVAVLMFVRRRASCRGR